MPWYEVIYEDGSCTLSHAKSIAEIRKYNPRVTKKTQFMHRRLCKRCRKVISTVQNTLCDPCWDECLEIMRAATPDLSISQQDLESLAMSFFVDG